MDNDKDIQTGGSLPQSVRSKNSLTRNGGGLQTNQSSNSPTDNRPEPDLTPTSMKEALGIALRRRVMDEQDKMNGDKTVDLSPHREKEDDRIILLKASKNI